MSAQINQSRYGVPERSVVVDSSLPASELTWSASSITTFEQCPLKFWWGKVAGWREGPCVATAAGSAVHSALEELFGREPNDRTPEVADHAFVEAVEGSRDELIAAQVPIDEVVAKGESSLAMYWQIEDPTTVEVQGIELKVGPELGELPFVGFVDRLSVSATGSIVSDYKTGNAKPKYFTPYFRQQYLYAAALQHEGHDVTEIELLFLGDGRRVRRPVYQAALDRAVGTLQASSTQANVMAAKGEWTARQSALCGWCSFETVCPLRRTRVPVPGSPESDERLAAVPGMVHRTPTSREQSDPVGQVVQVDIDDSELFDV
jgi:putative RecB family exonuclease